LAENIGSRIKHVTKKVTDPISGRKLISVKNAIAVPSPSDILLSLPFTRASAFKSFGSLAYALKT